MIKELNIQYPISSHLLRFITCGSVDDGKSTLIGRLLYDSKMVFEDQLTAVKNETKKYGTVKDEEIDFALLIDGLQSEREQGITIDVAYRFFSTDKRKYIIADTPGHEQYTRNMVTGASTADLAIILIDARKGILTQTRRHSFIVSLLGIRNIVVCINKMDLMDYKKEIFFQIVKDYERMYEKLKLSLPYKNFNQSIKFIPISALKGDNIVKNSNKMIWYEDESLMEYLDNVKISEMNNFKSFRFPVQYVNRANLDFRGYCGNIVSGSIEEGDKIVLYPSQKISKVKEIIKPVNPEMQKNPNIKKAFSSMAITLTLKDEIDIGRGDLIVKEGEIAPLFFDTFEAMIVWMDEEPLRLLERYELKIYSKVLGCKVERIFFKKDVNSWDKISVNLLQLNDIARCKISLDFPIAFDMYEENRATGAFILIDKITNNTVAAGMIVGTSSRQEENKRRYSEAEKELNRYIRKHYPEWECKKI